MEYTDFKNARKNPISGQTLLRIFPPRAKKQLASDKKIKNPNEVQLKIHVLYDPLTKQYKGLPLNFLSHINIQFNVNPKHLNSIKLDNYNDKIPEILLTLFSNIKNIKNGVKQIGLFRIAPNSLLNNDIKKSINKYGKLENKYSYNMEYIHIYANLIKVWFRELPVAILDNIDCNKIELCKNEIDAINVVNTMDEPTKSIFLWLCDVAAYVSQYHKFNKMNVKNLAIVMAPNLFNSKKFDNPMKIMTYSAKVVDFMKHTINARIIEQRKNKDYIEYENSIDQDDNKESESNNE